MDYDVLIQSSVANLILLFAYVFYKLCNRIAASKCQYSTEHGWEIHLPDPPNQEQVAETNSFFESRGFSMRLRPKDYPSIV